MQQCYVMRCNKNIDKLAEHFERINEMKKTSTEHHGMQKERDILKSFGVWSGYRLFSIYILLACFLTVRFYVFVSDGIPETDQRNLRHTYIYIYIYVCMYIHINYKHTYMDIHVYKWASGDDEKAQEKTKAIILYCKKHDLWSKDRIFPKDPTETNWVRDTSPVWSL